MKKLISSLALIIVFSFSGVASSENNTNYPVIANEECFDQVDVNKDGCIDTDEWSVVDSDTEFEAIDANGDGCLTLDEINAVGTLTCE